MKYTYRLQIIEVLSLQYPGNSVYFEQHYTTLAKLTRTNQIPYRKIQVQLKDKDTYQFIKADKIYRICRLIIN